jgi:hypothetical protein
LNPSDVIATFGMTVHPLCADYPAMDDQDFNSLQQDIEQHGLLVPIVLHKGQIIDGRHRFVACKNAGIEPRFDQWSGIGSLARYTWSMNGARRDLTQSQRATMAIVLLPYLEQEAAERKEKTQAKSGEKVGSKVTQKVESPSERNESTAAAVAAAVTGTNRQYVADAKKLKEDAPGRVAGFDLIGFR